jgi:hypothetical protein
MSSIKNSVAITNVENYEENIESVIDYYFEKLNNDFNNKYCGVIMYYDFIKEASVVELVDNNRLCRHLMNIFEEIKTFYDLECNCLLTFEVYGNFAYQNMRLLEFVNNVDGKEPSVNFKNAKIRFATNDTNAFVVFKSLLKFCEKKDDLNLLLEKLGYEQDELLDLYMGLYMKECKKKGNLKKFIKKPREEIPTEEIPREKTLSKKEKEKLKKQKAKEANKLREQEKKDKAKLAEQQAKQFEKQQKERERKRIETARKKKLALLKK